MHPTIEISPLRSFSLLGVLVALGCASAHPDGGSGERTGSAREAVDLAAIPANQIAIVQDGSSPAKATGVVFVPALDMNRAPTFVASTYGNLPVRGSCGLTFVSPHYAITSSHCFPDLFVYDALNQSFTTMTFDVSQANVDDFYFDAAMQGTFPNYTPIFGRTMNQEAGYTPTSFTCKIASRCAGPRASAYNCDGVTAPDVAMLYCATRPAHGGWLTIARDGAIAGDVYMYWFHELFSSNSTDVTAHYTNVNAIPIVDPTNWHYLAAPTNAFLPFKSVPWSATQQRTRTGAGNDSDVTTDLYGCHGTSGSGVLSLVGSSAYELLGPVHFAGPAWGAGQLCDSPSALTAGAPGGHGLTYNKNGSVNNLVNGKYLSALQADRAICGDGVCNGNETHATCPSDCPVVTCPSGTSDCCSDGLCHSAALCQKLGC